MPGRWSVMSAKSDADQLVRLLRHHGWAVRYTGTGHWIAEKGAREITLASTPNRAGLVRDKAKVRKALENADGPR
jgi:hypothetical protein